MKALLALALVAASATLSRAAIIQIDLLGRAGPGLLSGNETGSITGTPGTGGEMLGGITFDDVSKLLTVNVGWGSVNGFTDLTGTATLGHIHLATSGGDPFLATGSPTIDFTGNPNFTFATSASSGTVNGAQTLTPAQETALFAGNLYLNIHTSANGPGEIRGNLNAIPEPSSLLVMGLASLGLGLRRRRA